MTTAVTVCHAPRRECFASIRGMLMPIEPEVPLKRHGDGAYGRRWPAYRAQSAGGGTNITPRALPSPTLATMQSP